MKGCKEFFSAAKERDLNKVKRLFKKEFVNERDSVGYTALHCASGSSDGGIVRYLISVGFKVEAETKPERWRPLHVAAINGNIETMQALLEAHCSVDCVDYDGRTPLDYAIEYKKGNYGDCIGILEEAKIRTLREYKQMELIGKGAYAQVYKCQNMTTGSCLVKKEVAIFKNEKCLCFVKALEKEVDMYTKLAANRYIVRYHGYVRTNEAIFIYLEYMEGGSIEDQLTNDRHLPLDTVASYTTQILKGLSFLHNKKVIHRDIKPANILLDGNGNVKLCDFGVSRNLTRITSMPHTVAGTPLYMAPEVMKGADYSFSADLWSLGITVVEMLTGHPPYHQLSHYDHTLKMGSTTKLEYELPPKTPPKLQALIAQMLTIAPSGRGTAEQLLQS